MADDSSAATVAAASATLRPRAFAALRHPGFRAYIVTYVLAMMADNIEHVISYWVVFQKFHSPALGGFAVVSHWLPFLLFSVPVGALADRFDPRRLIQCGMLLFITASLGWGYFFVTDSLQMWQAMVLLVIHGCAGVLWQTSSQMLLHDIVAARRAGERGAPERDGALPRRVRRPRGRRRDDADAGLGARHLRQHALLPAAAGVALEGAVRAALSQRPAAAASRACAASPTSCRPCATSPAIRCWCR